MFAGEASPSPSPSTENSTHDQSLLKSTQIRKKNKNNKNNNSRRFTDEQIKSLESLFKMENKLEPRKKLEMARELGLHPRQVAIWFQNRRARWKSKQVEQDYTTLKADYDSLSDRFESLKKEKHALLEQLRSLCSQLKIDPDHEFETSKDLDSTGSENTENTDMVLYSDEDPDHHQRNQIQKEELGNINVGDDQVIIQEKHENVCSYDLSSLFDQSCGTCSSSNWWDYGWSLN